MDPSRPRAIGSTRTVVMRGGVTATKEFVVWNPDSHVVFRFNDCSNPKVVASGEEYRIETHPWWLSARLDHGQDPTGEPWLVRLVARRVMNRTYRRALVSLHRYTGGSRELCGG